MKAHDIVNWLLERYDFPDMGEQDKPEHYADFARPEDDPDDPASFVSKTVNTKIDKIEIQGRRWWRRGYGGEYNTSYIYVNDKHVATLPQNGGGGDMYLYRATDWLINNGYVTPERRGEQLWQMRDRLGFKLITNVVDVRRERDL